jgi:hypothetical protein
MNHDNLKKLDSNPVPENSKEIRVFMCIRNEVLRLPWVLEHHRRIGVDRFLIVDNASTDGSTDYLLSQNDVHCFYTEERYSESRWGLTWTNALLNSFGTGHWCLVIDADELFLYPECEAGRIQSFLRDMEASGYQALVALVLDMYSKVPIKEAVYRSGAPFLKTCPYFDGETYRVLRVRQHPPVQVYGGPRERVFWSDRSVQFHSPTMSVVPLIQWQSGYEYTCGRHCVNMPLHFAFFKGIIMHFKYFHDFYERIEKEAKRGEHFAGAREYNMYLQYLKDNPEFTFYYEGSALYENSTQLVEYNLMERFD